MLKRLLTALLCAALGACSHGAREPVSGRPASLRLPDLPAPWSEADRRHLGRSLESVFADPILGGAGLIVLAGDGTTLFARHANVPMTPASSIKLLIAATALDVLGPARRFDTSFVALNQPEGGTLEGPLWLVGGGDPVLSSADLRGGVGVLAASGLRAIAGDLIVDATAFSGPEQNAAWSSEDLGEDYAAGTSALSLDWDVAQFVVSPSEPGLPARVEIVPRNRNVAFTGGVTTTYATDVLIDRVPAPAPPQRNDFTVSGHIAAGTPQSFYLPILGIPWFVGGAAAAMLQDRGIALSGAVRAGDSPLGGTTLWLHHSPPLGTLVRQMLVHSDNHIAEQLLRIVGGERGPRGTDQAGVHVEKTWLARAGIPAAGLTIVDGSGLSPNDKVTPAVLAAVVTHASRGRNGSTFLNALPLVGIEGTVRRHQLNAARGRARAKSGHIEAVNALAGTVLTARHGRVAFAFIVNDPRSDAGAVSVAQDRALDALAEF